MVWLHHRAFVGCSQEKGCAENRRRQLRQQRLRRLQSAAPQLGARYRSAKAQRMPYADLVRAAQKSEKRVVQQYRNQRQANSRPPSLAAVLRLDREDAAPRSSPLPERVSPSPPRLRAYRLCVLPERAQSLYHLGEGIGRRPARCAARAIGGRLDAEKYSGDRT
jgi:hypothetical protein